MPTVETQQANGALIDAMRASKNMSRSIWPSARIKATISTVPTTRSWRSSLTRTKSPREKLTACIQKGVESFNKQRFEEEAGCLNRAFQASGNSCAGALVFLGRAQQSLGRNDAAVKTFEAAMKIRPSDYQSRILLAEAS